ncbi:FadR/GntR family transcriptional regulator [Gracilibacillus sp. D59]|uniref:FadR/GntR family transcriptional regulator n=1 Tax=Gracilibacillus sp. D59 TaxID=3457434 RepID=UPI003FCC76F7
MFQSINFQKTTISRKVVDYIRNLIINEELTQGEKLPSEREMSEILNVSRNTVREAYQILASLGYVQIKHGQGVFVSSDTESIQQWAASFFNKNDQLIELFAIRKLLETQSVKWAVNNIQNDNINELNSFIEKDMEYINNKEKYFDISSSDQKFHLLIAKLSGNSVLFRIMYNLIDLMKEVRVEALQIPGRMEKSIGEHKEIVKALSEKDVDKAEKKMLEHLNSVEETLVKNISDKDN